MNRAGRAVASRLHRASIMKSGALVVIVGVMGVVVLSLGCSVEPESTFVDPTTPMSAGVFTTEPPPPSAPLQNKSGPSDAGTTGASPTTLRAVVRDFRVYNAADKSTSPDFENVPRTDASGAPSASYLGPWDDRAIVTSMLGADGKPIYARADAVTLTTHGRATFDQWFRDVPGTNVAVELPLALSRNARGEYEFDSEKTGVPLSATDPTRNFFPIDDGLPTHTPFGNQGDAHNYSFTMELRTQFVYQGGEFFSFRGDDDVFVYIDGKLVINLGGIHGPEAATVNVDDLGLVKGKTYPLDFFSAERHRTGSNILFTTSLDLEPSPVR
jgi:fibro-slime domain-containing protein